MSPLTRPQTIHVCRDTTAGTHHTNSDEIAWWLPVIGPTAAVLASLLSRTTPQTGATWQVDTLARTIGLGSNGRQLWCALERLAMFRVATFHAVDVITIRTELPALSDRQLERLPDELANEYVARFLGRAA